MPSYSNYQLGDKILKELGSRGHEVTVITPYQDKTPIKNFKQVVLTGVLEQTREVAINLYERPDLGVASCVVLSTVAASRWTNPQMGNPGPPSYIPDLFLS
ncbi:hypothetical protein ILUMI_16873, partial [Ignelater luminosus]